MAEEKLLSSGLTLDDAKELGIEIIDAEKVPKLHSIFKPLASIKFKYFTPTGEDAVDWPGGKPYYRLRYLEQGTGFDALSKKSLRYVQEPSTAPVAYYPQNQDWSGIVGNPDVPVVITEGELKAAKACREGFPTIGLGGVYSWRSHKLGITWIESLDYVNWCRRNVYICFDSDYQTNPMVCAALHELAEALHRRGAFAHIVSLPDLDGLDKVGLDDFLVHSGPSANAMFRELLTYAEPLGLTAPLWDLNNRYVYVENPGLVLNQRTYSKTNPTAFTSHLESTSNYQERRLKPDGSISFQAVPASNAWLKWPLRTQVSKLTYEPGKEKFINMPNTAYNIWPGWGIEPREGDVEPFLDLVDHLFTDSEPEAKDWFLKWCAYPLQFPGSKMFSSVVFHGIRHGTGKSFIGYTLGRIYGENFTEIAQLDLHNGFNEWAEGKQFVMGDDVTGSNKRADADFLKKLITQRTLRVNIKYVPSYTVPDCVNYFFTANHPDAFFLEDDDRRFFVHEVKVGPLPEEFYVNYDLWIDSGGSNAVFKYFLDFDLGDFNPYAPAFKTLAKERMIVNMQSDLAAWVRQLMVTPEHVLKVGEIPIDKDLFSSKELLQLYDPTGKTGTTANGLGRELARAGVQQVCGGRPVRLADGSQTRFYAIRDSDGWLKKSSGEIIDHLNSWIKKQKNFAKVAKY